MSIRWKLVSIYITLVFIVMLVSGTFILIRLNSQETENAQQELKQCALYINEQIIQEYQNPDDFQTGFENLFLVRSQNRSIQGNILDSSGHTIASSVTNDKNLFTDYKNSVVISALAGKESFGSSSRNIDLNSYIKDWISYAYPIFDGSGKTQYVIYVQMDGASIKESLSQSAGTILVAVILALILAGILGLIFADTITSPISVLTNGADMLAEGADEFNTIDIPAIPVKSDDEIGRLTKSFNYMSSKLKKTLSELKNENNKLEIVMHNMTDGVSAFDANGSIIHANSVFYEMLSEIKKDINLNELLETVNVKMEELAPDVTLEKIIKEKEKYLSVSLIPYTISSKQVEGVVAVLQDITKHRRLDDMRKEFVANVSHEIRTPLTTIKSYTETLIDGAIDDKETAIEFLNVINDAADRMSLLSKDLLELSKLDTKQVKFNMDKISLVKLTEDCIKQNIIIAKNKNQARKGDKPKKDMIIYADYGRIGQVINNIISNAIKYSGEGADIKIKAEEKENNYQVIISDNGMGISQEDLKRIFERFYRVDKARSRAMGGNGLGLSIAKEIMEGHGGSIKAYSQPSKGTDMILIFKKP